VLYHVFADVDAADGGDVAAEGLGDGAGAAGVVEEADFSSCRGRGGGGGGLVMLFFWCGPLGAEPVFALLEG
jgi:hypothetical protein